MIRDLIAKCKSCGIDVDHQAAQLEQTVQQAARLKATFFPEEP